MDYVQELVRQVVSATGHRERMSREGMVMHGGKAPSGDALRYERLIAEIASGLKMAEFGLPAKLSPESRGMVEYWTEELKENPCLIDRSEEHTSELQSRQYLVCRLLLEKKKKRIACTRLLW